MAIDTKRQDHQFKDFLEALFDNDENKVKSLLSEVDIEQKVPHISGGMSVLEAYARSSDVGYIDPDIIQMLLNSYGNEYLSNNTKAFEYLSKKIEDAMSKIAILRKPKKMTDSAIEGFLKSVKFIPGNHSIEEGAGESELLKFEASINESNELIKPYANKKNHPPKTSLESIENLKPFQEPELTLAGFIKKFSLTMHEVIKGWFVKKALPVEIDADLKKEFISNIKMNNTGNVKELLKEQPLLSQLIIEGDLIEDEPILMVAARECSAPIVECLAHYGADVNQSVDNKTALSEAVAYGNLGSIESLVKHGANLKRKGFFNNNAFHDYAKEDCFISEAVIHKLITLGVNVHEKNNLEQTALDMLDRKAKQLPDYLKSLKNGRLNTINNRLKNMKAINSDLSKSEIDGKIQALNDMAVQAKEYLTNIRKENLLSKSPGFLSFFQKTRQADQNKPDVSRPEQISSEETPQETPKSSH